MLHNLKNLLYFPVARYFGLFAGIRLRRWKPRVVVVTGSNGKTTALHMIEAQLGLAARYSHHRNSAFGIAFDILGLGDAADSRWNWILLAFLAPIYTWRRPPSEKIYIAEADCDRPGEGRFLSSLLFPEVVVWLNSARTHSEKFARAAAAAKESVDERIAYEFGFFLERASTLVILNGDDERIVRQSQRTRARIEEITEARRLGGYEVSKSGTVFDVRGKKYSFPYLLPQDVFRAIVASEVVATYFNVPVSGDLSRFTLPPGRSSLFKGIKGTTIIDSSYNINVGSLAAIVGMVKHIKGEQWLVLGDMTEQGAYEREEHEKVARMVSGESFVRVILVGPRMRAVALPILLESGKKVESFDVPKDALNYLRSALGGGEIIIFKGARFLEGIVEYMLADPRDASKLCRREPRWQARRTQWGLPAPLEASKRGATS